MSIAMPFVNAIDAACRHRQKRLLRFACPQLICRTCTKLVYIYNPCKGSTTNESGIYCLHNTSFRMWQRGIGKYSKRILGTMKQNALQGPESNRRGNFVGAVSIYLLLKAHFFAATLFMLIRLLYSAYCQIICCVFTHVHGWPIHTSLACAFSSKRTRACSMQYKVHNPTQKACSDRQMDAALTS